MMPDENPYKPFRRVRGAVDSAKRVTDERFGAWELGYNARCPEGWIVVRLDEHEARMRECEALRLEREDARAERDAAIAALNQIADLGVVDDSDADRMREIAAEALPWRPGRDDPR